MALFKIIILKVMVLLTDMQWFHLRSTIIYMMLQPSVLFSQIFLKIHWIVQQNI